MSLDCTRGERSLRSLLRGGEAWRRYPKGKKLGSAGLSMLSRKLAGAGGGLGEARNASSK